MKDRPLYLLDADEVLIAFVDPFASFLEKKGYRLHFRNFALAGNIYPLESDAPCEENAVAKLIAEYFNSCCDRCEALPGAVEAVRTLQKFGDVVVLTNVPAHLAERRRLALARIGIESPLTANRGPKGPRARELAEGRRAAVVFLDDLPLQHASVARHAPFVRRVHFLAHPRLRDLVPPADAAERSFSNWPECLEYLIEITG